MTMIVVIVVSLVSAAIVAGHLYVEDRQHRRYVESVALQSKLDEWRHWAADLLHDLGRIPLAGLDSRRSRELIAELAKQAAPAARCTRCGCFATRHRANASRECVDCECTRIEVEA